MLKTRTWYGQQQSLHRVVIKPMFKKNTAPTSRQFYKGGSCSSDGEKFEKNIIVKKGNKGDEDNVRTIICPCCDGTGEIFTEHVNTYVSWMQHPDDLRLMMSNLGCDDRAIGIAINYVKRVGIEGFDEVNDVIHGLFKNWSCVRNASAFVTNAVDTKKKARFPQTW